jgi:hypothetical protein
MKYSELINFEPIESVKELRAANAIDQARLDVDSFVISDRMLGLIRDVIAPNLQLDKPADAKGLLIVANYGTGKTHLMSTISAAAEHSELLGLLRRTEAADALKSVAGRYMVVRSEIGATEMSLRDIVCRDLESSLKRMGVEFKFPDLDQVPRTKDSLEEMMSIFDKA